MNDQIKDLKHSLDLKHIQLDETINRNNIMH